MATYDALTFTALRQANAARQAEWCTDRVPDLSFRGNEMAGEVGEACNVIKKLERARWGWHGSRATVADLAKELADVVICADLVAMQIGADLGAAIAAKFDEASEKNGLATRILVRGRSEYIEMIQASDVRKAMEDGAGFWRSCTGCHELNEGVPTGRRSHALRCNLGLGCRECGGIGAVWDTTDYEDMGRAMAESGDDHAEPATSGSARLDDLIAAAKLSGPMSEEQIAAQRANWAAAEMHLDRKSEG